MQPLSAQGRRVAGGDTDTVHYQVAVWQGIEGAWLQANHSGVAMQIFLPWDAAAEREGGVLCGRGIGPLSLGNRFGGRLKSGGGRAAWDRAESGAEDGMRRARVTLTLGRG